MTVFNRDVLELIFSYVESSTPDVCLSNAYDFAVNRILEIEEEEGFCYFDNPTITVVFDTVTSKEVGSLCIGSKHNSPLLGTFFEPHTELKVVHETEHEFRFTFTIDWENWCNTTGEQYVYTREQRVSLNAPNPFESFDMLETLPRKSANPFGELIMAPRISFDDAMEQYILPGLDPFVHCQVSKGVVMQFQEYLHGIYTAKDLADEILK